MSAGQLEAHLFGGAVQGPSCSLTTDRITLDQRQMWRHLLAACSGTLDREGGLDHRGGTREDQKLSPPGCVLQLRRVGRRPLTCEDVGKKKKEMNLCSSLCSQDK